MQQLSPAYQMVFNLYVMESYSHQEIADALGISVGTSKSNLAKARMNMKKLLKKQFAHRF
jgi:RNA polymerase sigma-70 factor (ECF subfamily)